MTESFKFYRCETNPDGSMTIKGKLVNDGSEREEAAKRLIDVGGFTSAEDSRVRTMGEFLHNLDHFGYSKAAAHMYAGLRQAGWSDDQIQNERMKFTPDDGGCEPASYVIKPDSAEDES